MTKIYRKVRRNPKSSVRDRLPWMAMQILLAACTVRLSACFRHSARDGGMTLNFCTHVDQETHAGGLIRDIIIIIIIIIYFRDMFQPG